MQNNNYKVQIQRLKAITLHNLAILKATFETPYFPSRQVLSNENAGKETYHTTKKETQALRDIFSH